MNIDRVLLVNKPKGWTSFDVVAKIRGHVQTQYNLALQDQPELCACNECNAEAKRRSETPAEGKTDYPKRKHKIKVGHCGTLDPLATGLLVIVTGKNTKKVPEFIKQDKVYEVELTLGATSDTGDAEGELTQIKDWETKLEELNEKMVKEVIRGFLGEISQVPPVYSAIKINGQRAYKLAREGKEVKLEPRKVTVHGIKDVSLSANKVTFTAHVSSGTYIRSLVEDIGKALGTGAYMSALCRTGIGDFDIKNALQINDITS